MAATEEDDLHQHSIMGELDWEPLKLTLVEYPKVKLYLNTLSRCCANEASNEVASCDNFSRLVNSYNIGDWLGKILAIASLSPFGILSGFVALILFRRDVHTIVFFLGTMFSELLNEILKYTICEPRPTYRQNLYTEYGMPSAHSQFMFFFATYIVYFVFIRLHHMNNNTTLENFWKIVIISLCVSLAIIVSISRVYLQYHTWRQVLCGALVGFIFGSLWFAATYFVFTPLFPVVVSWRVSEFLLLRDTTLIPNVLWFEYTNTRQEARARGRKLVSMKSQ